jgi:hypothetical protein
LWYVVVEASCVSIQAKELKKFQIHSRKKKLLSRHCTFSSLSHIRSLVHKTWYSNLKSYQPKRAENWTTVEKKTTSHEEITLVF